MDLFIEEKQKESRRVSMQNETALVGEQLEAAVSSVCAMFERVGLSRDLLLNSESNQILAVSEAAIQEMKDEPDNETLVITQIKNQNKEQKAQQSYEDNMDVQGFGSTFASGFYQTTSDFGATMSSSFRSQSALMRMESRADDIQETMSSNPLKTELGDDEEEERRVQMEFEESMRATSMSFFKTAKSTFMSTNDL